MINEEIKGKYVKPLNVLHANQYQSFPPVHNIIIDASFKYYTIECN